MGTEKQRLKRWRERNKKEGRKSVTIMLSAEAHSILHKAKQAHGTSFAAIVEKALLNLAGTGVKPEPPSVTSNVPDTVKPPPVVRHIDRIIDDNAILDADMKETGYGGTILMMEESSPRGLLPRLFRRSKKPIPLPRKKM